MAYVVVARKMLTVIWHLLVDDEIYVEEGFSKVTAKAKSSYAGRVPLERIVEFLKKCWIYSCRNWLEKGFS